MKAAIEIENLCHRFPDGAESLSGIDLVVKKGEFVVVAGENGSGKTTLFRHLNGLLKPSGGEVKINGVSVSDKEVFSGIPVGLVFQNADSQIVGETVYDDIAFGPENLLLSRSEIKWRVERALQSVGLRHLADRPCHRLSGGEKKRLAIAGILALGSEIIAFDEPFTNLDYSGFRQVLSRMVRLHKEGRTLLVSTHDIEKVMAHADRLVVLRKGRVVFDEKADEVDHFLEPYGVRTPCYLKMGKKPESWLS